MVRQTWRDYLLEPTTSSDSPIRSADPLVWVYKTRDVYHGDPGKCQAMARKVVAKPMGRMRRLTAIAQGRSACGFCGTATRS